MSAVTEDWKAQARELRESGLSEREVAESVGKAASTVHAYFKREGIVPRTVFVAVGGSDSGPSDEAANPEPDTPDLPNEPDESSAEWEYEHGGGADRAGATTANGSQHLTPFRTEQARLEAAAGDSSGGGERARIGESGDVEWESESVYVPLAELRVDGTSQLSMFDVGGKRATDSSLRLQGGRVQLADGQAFRKGDVVRLEVTAVVREVGQRDKPDPATGIVVSAEQKHVAYITDLRVLS